MKVIVCKDYAEVSKEAYKVMKEVMTSKEEVVLGLATGSTPIGLYQEMAKDYKAGNVSYKNTKTFNLDEYVGIDRNHPESYYTFMNTNLFEHIDIDTNNTILPYGDTAKDCADYEASMSACSIDLQVLGIGGNAHIGFNEPGTSFDSLTHIVDLQEATIKDNARFFDNDMSKVPTQAISMGIATIMKSKKVILIASGANKADAVYGMVKGEITEVVPASILQNHADVILVVDEAAASKL